MLSASVDMRGIRKLKNRFRVERMYQGNRASGYANTLLEALQLREQLDSELRGEGSTRASQTLPKEPTGWPLSMACSITFKRFWSDGTASNVKCHQGRIKHILEFFGEDTNVQTITTDQIYEFREWLAQTYNNSESTQNRKIVALSRVLRTALEHGKLDKMPNMLIVPVKNGRLRFMTDEEERQTIFTFERLATPDHVDALIVLVDTGFRLGELWKITASHMNLEKNTLSLWDHETKTQRGRTVGMTTRVRKILLERAEEYGEGALFPYTNSWFQYSWTKVRIALGKEDDPDWVTHMLRHTCCSRLVQKNVPLFIVQRWMGHSNILTTQRYAHFGANYLDSAVSALEG